MTALLALTGRAAGIRYGLEPRTTIGRASDSTIQLLDDAVSRHHLCIEARDDVHFVEDLGSANGSTLDGQPLTARVALRPGQLIGVGATTFVYAPRLDYVVGEDADVIVDERSATVAEREVPVAGDESSPEAALAADAVLTTLADALHTRGRVQLLGAALVVVAERLGAQRAMVLTREEGRRARVRASFGAGPITISRTVVDRVYDDRRAVHSANAADDVSFEGGVSLAAGEVRSLLAAPLLASGRVVGMVHLDRRDRGGFGEGALKAFVPLANTLALVLLAEDGIEALGRRARAEHEVEAPDVVAESAAMKRVVDEAQRAARSTATVLVTGPTGSGKEVVARLVHAASDRADRPFVAVNCGALVASLEESELFGHEKGAFTGADRQRVGLFEAADGGTLFLDEIGDTSRATQVKLLRALQERAIFRVGGTKPIAVDVRIVAATSRRLEEAIAAKDFREDLFFRLSVVRIEVPPLAARAEDVVPLARAFVARTCRAGGILPKRLHADAEAMLERYPWPGNVRELANLVERVVILADADELLPADLPLELWTEGDVAARATARADTLSEAVGRVERAMILRAIARTGAVKTAVADALGISRVTLDAKLRAHDIPWPKRR